MNAQTRTMFASLRHSDPMICGVCARLADRSGLSVTLLRVVAVLLLLSHTVLLVAVYIGVAAWMRRCERRAWSAGAPRNASTFVGVGAAPNLTMWHRSELNDRFARLEKRLSQMEGATLDRELGLRRAFRDLDR